MPYRIVTARTEPARSIVWTVAVLTLLGQIVATVLSWPVGLGSFAIVGPVCVYGAWASHKNTNKHMSYASFWLGMMWVWTGLTRLLVVDGAGELLWIPFLIIGAVCGVVYLYTSFQKRIGDLD